MNLAAYNQAAIPEPHTILGLRLLPFSIGHRRLLRAIGNAFVCGGDVTYDDLVTAVLICAQTYQGARATIYDAFENHFAHNKAMLKWQRQLCGQTGLFWFLKNGKPIDLKAKAREFVEYMEAGSQHPEYKHTSDGREIDAPLEEIVRVTLLTDTTLTEEEILNRSWSECLSDYVLMKTIEGGIDLVDHDEINDLVSNAKEYFKRNPVKN